MNRFGGFERLSDAKVFILQGGLAAGLSFWFAHQIIGHAHPFFAPMASVIALGTTAGGKLRRSVELVLGVSIGVGVGDVIVSRIGTGYWQIALAVMCALSLAVFLDRSPLAPVQASCSAVLVATIMPPGTTGGISRMEDALIGGFIGITVMALVPHSALRPARREVSFVLELESRVLRDVSEGLGQGDLAVITDALASVRGTQAKINSMIAAVDSGSEVVIVSPFYWGSRHEIKRLGRILTPVDNSIRNTRVLARRAATIVSDRQPVDPAIPTLLAVIAEACEQLSKMYGAQGRWAKVERARLLPEIERRLRIAAGASQVDRGLQSGVSGVVVMAQARSVIVDLLQVCGFSREEAVAVLRPVEAADDSVQPEVWE